MCERAKIFYRSSTVSFVCGLFSGETSKCALFLLVNYHCLPRIFLEPLMKTNSFQTIFILRRAVCTVLSVRSLAQIGPAIIRAISIAMIYLLRWVSLGHVKPNQSVCGPMPAIDLKINVTFPMPRTRDLAHAYFRSRRAPRKQSCLRIVMQNTKQLFMRDHAGIFTGIEIKTQHGFA